MKEGGGLSLVSYTSPFCTPCPEPWKDPAGPVGAALAQGSLSASAAMWLLSLSSPSPSMSLSFPSVSMATHHFSLPASQPLPGILSPALPSLLQSPGSCSPVSSPWGESRGSLLFPDCHIFSSSNRVSSSGETIPPHPPPATAHQPFPPYSRLKGVRTLSLSHAPMPRSALSVIPFCHWLGKQASLQS